MLYSYKIFNRSKKTVLSNLSQLANLMGYCPRKMYKIVKDNMFKNNKNVQEFTTLDGELFEVYVIENKKR